MNPDIMSLLSKMSIDADFEGEKLLQLCEDTNAETVLKILAQFHETLKQSAQVTETAMAEKNVEPIWKAAHKVAGSADLLGFGIYGNKSRILSHQLRDKADFAFYSDQIQHFLSRTKEVQGIISNSFTNLNDYLA